MEAKSRNFTAFHILFTAFLLEMCLHLFPLSLWAQDGKIPLRLSFTEALRRAKEQHVETIVSNERVQQAITRIAQARSSLLPQVTGTASQSRQTINLQATIGVNIPIPGFNNLVGPFNSMDARIALAQTIFDFAAIQRLRSAKVGRSLSVANMEKTQQDVMALVGNLYLEARRAQDTVALTRALVKRDQERLRLARSKSGLGLGTSLDVTQLEADLADEKSRLTQAITDSTERRFDLIAALGLTPDTNLVFVNKDPLVPLSLSELEKPDAYVGVHPDVRQAQKDLEQKKADKKVEQAGYFPKISGFANYGASGTSPANADDTYAYGGHLTIPLYEGGLRQARVKEADHKIKESEARLADAKIQTGAKILSARETMKKALSLLRSAKADLTAAKRQLSVAQDRLQLGLGTDLEVVEAQAGYASAKDRAGEAEATYQLAQVNLAHALGRMESLIGK